MFIKRSSMLIVALAMALSVWTAGAIAQETPEGSGSEDEVDAVVRWVAANAVDIVTDSVGQGFEDLMPLKAAIGDARIVSIGEATHGTREVFRMKHRVFEMLVAKMGFRYFGIEASLPDCTPISEYVLHGEGNPEAVLHGQGFWTWDTEEVLELINWMRAYNAGRPDQEKVHFFGYDMQNPRQALDFAIEYLDSNGLCSETDFRGQYASLLQDSMANFYVIWEDYSPAQRDSFRVFVNDLLAALDNNRDQCIAATSSEAWTMARLHASVAVQTEEMRRVGRTFEPSIGIRRWYEAWYSIDESSTKLSDALRLASPELWESTRELTNQLEKGAQEFCDIYGQLTAAERQAFHAHARSLASYFESSHDSLRGEVAGVAKDIVPFLTSLDDFEAMPEKEPNVRDRCMADNISWLLDHVEPNAKIMLWAHNLHVMRVPEEAGYGTMGNELEIRYGDDHFVVGFMFNRGSFQAAYMEQTESGAWAQKLKPFTDGAAIDGSVEWVFSKVGKPQFVVDLRKLPLEGPVATWFSREHPMRNIGAGYQAGSETGHYFNPAQLPDCYDAVIFMDSTSAARPNQLTQKRFGLD